MARFYRDRGIPEVTRLARAYCRYWGLDPDEPVQETGYDETTIPRWWRHQDAASSFLAMMAAYQEPDPEAEAPTLAVPVSPRAEGE